MIRITACVALALTACPVAAACSLSLERETAIAERQVENAYGCYDALWTGEVVAACDRMADNADAFFNAADCVIGVLPQRGDGESLGVYMDSLPDYQRRALLAVDEANTWTDLAAKRLLEMD
ncbi:MAG: hypothetical protein AAFY19_00780 [Pseudomonadota bacterium]